MQWNWDALQPYAQPAAIGCLVGWTMVQLAKVARRDRGLPKFSNLEHRLIAMCTATIGTLVATMLDGLNNRQAMALALLVGVLCPTLVSLALALTRDKEGWMGAVHWFLRGNRRVRQRHPHPQRRVEDDMDPEDTWH